MHLPSLSAQTVARALEWSGYGPVGVTGKMGIQVRIPKREAPGGFLEFNLDLQPDGGLVGFPAMWTYRNRLHPLVRAVMSVVTHVFIGFGERDFYEGVITEDFDSKSVSARSIYLWLLENKNPQVRDRLVLNELYFRGEPVWCQLSTTDYDNNVYTTFYNDQEALLIDFKEHGIASRGKGVEAILNACILACDDCKENS